MKYFGTDGIRRIANTELTPEFAYKIAKAGAYVLTKHIEKGKTPRIIIGRDTRISGTLIESAMTAGFLSSGANVELVEIAPTPSIAYLTKKTDADLSVVISASHNTFEYNGIKYFSKLGTKIADDIEEEIEEAIDSGIALEKKVEHHKIGVSQIRNDLLDVYFEFIMGIFKKDIEKLHKNDFKVAIDTANGATYKIAEKVFKELGINYTIINNNPDGININKECGSTHLEILKNYVVKNGMSIGIAYDGDGDRCLTIDENGNEVNGDKILAIFAKYLKDNNKLEKNKLVATVMSNIGLKKFAKENDIEFVATKVGDRYVLEDMLKNGGNLGGEQSGHIILSDYNLTGDGIVTSLILIKILLEKGVTFSKLCSIIKIYPQILINVKTKKSDFENDDEIMRKIKDVEEELKDNGRVLIRKSGTEPLIRVMLEGENENYIKIKAQEIADLVQKKLN